MIVFVCWMWRGWRGTVYSAWQVNALAAMLARHMSAPYRLVCLCEDPTGIRCETAPLPPRPPRPQQSQRLNNYVKLRLFDPAVQHLVGAGPGDVLVSIDLDALILADLAPLFGEPDTRPPLQLMAGIYQRYNSSLVMLRPGYRADIWHEFEANVQGAARRIDAARRRGGTRPLTGSDQAWICLREDKAPTWGPGDGVVQYCAASDEQLRAARLVFFAGTNWKPWGDAVARRHAWIRQQYLLEAGPRP